MDRLTVLITGAGAPGIKGTLYSLKNNPDNRIIRTIGTDIKRDAIGKYLCDAFYQIHIPSSEKYVPDLKSICKKENVDVLLPQNTAELEILAERKNEFKKMGVNVAVSSLTSIQLSNNKCALLNVAKKIDIPTPDFTIVETQADLVRSANHLGWPERPIVIKPPDSNGMRGLRIIDEKKDFKKLFFSEKPTSLYTTMSDIKAVLGHSFPQLMVMEYLPKEEYTVDILQSNPSVIVPRKRDVMKSGITFHGTAEKNDAIIEYSKKLSEKLQLEYAFGFQFKNDADNIPKLLECNPRIQGTMVLSTFAGANIIYGAVQRALNEPVSSGDIKWGTRIMRYWGGIGIHNEQITDVL
jgi:carbamoyl-phosphate synthase large subunit